MTRREYTGAAPVTTLAAAIASGTLSFTVATGGGDGYPTGAVGPFFIVIDENTANEEKVLCANRVGDLFNVAGSGRGADGTQAVAHSAGATVRHIYTATDADEANAHVNSEAGHGTTTPIVGENDLQTLTNKIMSGSSNTFSNIPQSAVTNLVTDLGNRLNKVTELGTGWLSALGAALGTGWAAELAAAISGALVHTTKTQTLTNKTIDGGSNTLKNALNRIATTTADTDSAGVTTTETTVMSVTAALETGKTYRVAFFGGFNSTVSGDAFFVRIREDNATGTEMQSATADIPGAGSTPWNVPLEAEYTAGSTGNKTFVVTLVRGAAATGTVRRESASTRKAYLYVDYVRG